MPKRQLYKVKEVPTQKLSRLVTRAFLQDFKRHGLAAVEKVREDNPADYLRIVTKLLPKQVDVGVQHSFSDVLLAAAAEAQNSVTAQPNPVLDCVPESVSDCRQLAIIDEQAGVGAGGGG